MNDLVNQMWCLVERPQGRLTEANFEWREAPVPAPQDGEVVVQVRLLSLDPTNRTWANARDTYLPAIPLGSVMRGTALGEVVASKSADIAVGDTVIGLLGWQTYAVMPAKRLTKLPPLPGTMPLEAHFGLLGHIGLTAYFGLLEIGRPQPGETLLVSAAAGAVGSLVGQIGKIKGCRVVGTAGTDEKCRWLTETLGFDAAINYKKPGLFSAVRDACPDGIDIYFDNVGGDILNVALAYINRGARIPLCGAISTYNAKQPPPGPSNLPNMISKRASMQGFVVTDYLSRAAEAFPDLVQWHLSGQLNYRTDVVDGLENAPTALNKLFDGTNQGKLLIAVA